MRYFILITFFIFINSIGYSQSTYFNVEETAPFKDIKKGSNLLGVHQFDNGEAVLIRAIKKDYVVSAFDASHNLIANIKLETSKKETIIGSVATEGLVRVFTSDKVDKKNIDVYCRTYFLSSKRIEKVKLYSKETGKRRKTSIFTLFNPIPRKYEENFRVSPNGEYIAFSIDNVNSKTTSSLIKVFDKSLTEMYEREYVKETENLYRFDDFIITDEAEILTAGKLYKDGFKDKKKGKANYEYVLHKVSEDDHSYKTIDLGENFIQEVRFAQTDNAIRLLGFYSEKNSFRMKGGISYVFNGTDITNVTPKVTPFPKSIYNDLYSEAAAERRKKKEKEFRSYYLDYTIIDEEDNAYLTAEQFYITQHTVNNGPNGGFTTITTYHYDNILAIKFDKEGNLVWGRSILKKSNSPSYNAFAVDGKLHILLNTGKNIKEKSNGRKKVKKGWLEKSALFDIVFDEQGGETYQMIKENDGRKDFYSPSSGNYDYNTFIMANLSKNKRQFLILSKK
ncbi:hypothetical protein [uncultured Dokdonia sp.]|uniref:hypothetical protein n=1 Tax=uncultured Dokdonia sp. TaxID=575653 RepID=UPI0026019B35|nr:hypothetical protein [uncultured Dokdonia sp.]